MSEFKFGDHVQISHRATSTSTAKRHPHAGARGVYVSSFMIEGLEARCRVVVESRYGGWEVSTLHIADIAKIDFGSDLTTLHIADIAKIDFGSDLTAPPVPGFGAVVEVGGNANGWCAGKAVQGVVAADGLDDEGDVSVLVRPSDRVTAGGKWIYARPERIRELVPAPDVLSASVTESTQ